MNETSRFYIITGSSGVGKSTMIPFLKEQLTEKFNVHDFDEKLTGEVAANNNLLDSWRKETTSYWIEQVKKNAEKGISTIVVGLIYPKEVMEIKPEIPVSFCLLTASNEKIEERLKGKRFSDTDKILGLKNATGKTPEEFMTENIILVGNLQEEIKSVNGTIINTTNDTPEQTADKVLGWLNE